MTVVRRVVRGLVLLLALLTAGHARADLIHMGYIQELYVDQGPGHFTFDFLRAAELIIADSGVSVDWVPVPIARISSLIERPDYQFCLAGAVITKEREEVGHFSIPYVYDGAIALIARAERKEQLARLRSFAELVSATHAEFLVYKMANYGPTFTAELKDLGVAVAYQLGSAEQMLDMIAAKRAEFALLPGNYARNFLATRHDAAEFALVSYPDMVRGMDSAFYCNKAVSKQTIAALNASIVRQKAVIRERFPNLARPGASP